MATQRSLLATVVSYCSNERPFVNAVLQNALLFSDVVVLAVGSRLYNGVPEDEAHIQALSHLFPDVNVARYDVTDAALSRPVDLHNAARIVGVAAAREALETRSPTTMTTAGFWALLLDGDEVPDGPIFALWWQAARLRPQVPVKLANYWYFLSKRLVAETHEDSVLLVHSSLLTDAALTHPRERDGIVACAGGVAPLRAVNGPDCSTPMFHHYSWVREDRAALLRKVANWGHSGDRPWAELLQHQMDEVDAGRWPTHDFVHGYRLRLL